MIADRSLVLRDGVLLASPLAAVIGAFLFFAGHNQAGGGFAAGLVFGCVCALRCVVGLSVPRHPIALMALGGALVGVVASAPLLVGDVALDQYVWETSLPLLGDVKAGTALVFDLGVTMIVLGLIVAVLEGLGAARMFGPPEPAETEIQGADR
jgi:multisubunit Na+/H+ antiporter MnhB subunit